MGFIQITRSTAKRLLNFYSRNVKMCSCSHFEYSNKLVFFINGKKIEDAFVDPDWTLLFYLRNKLRLYGTKRVCEEGGCGSCTVMVSKYDRENQKEVHFPINSCIAPICSIHGLAVTTVEGIGSTKTQLHPVQERIAKAHGIQCGYCTPGIVMSMYTCLRQDLNLTMENLTESLQGNFCRCTGYRPILDAYRTFTNQCRCEFGMSINGVCPLKAQCAADKEENVEKLFNIDIEDCVAYNPTQEPNLPQELRTSNKYDQEFLKIKGPSTTWLRPSTLDQLLTIHFFNPEAKLVAGNTITIFEIKFLFKSFPILVHTRGVPELTRMSETVDGVKIGAAASIEEIDAFLMQIIEKYPEEKTRLFTTILELHQWIGTKQTRSLGTMGGNILAGSPTADFIPILTAGRVQLEAHHKEKGVEMIPLDTEFTLGHHQNKLGNKAILVAIHLPFSNKNQYFQTYTQSRRRDSDENIVSFSLKVEFENNSDIISSIYFGIGGVAETPVEAPNTTKILKGHRWTRDLMEKSYPLLLAELPLNFVPPRGMGQYRDALVLSLFLRSFLNISMQLQNSIKRDEKDLIRSDEISGTEKFCHKEYKSSQYFTKVPDSQCPKDLVGRPVMRTSAFREATGEAVFVDDMPKLENQLFMEFVLSTSSHAKIVSIDATEALKIKGVHAFFSENDIPEEMNQTGRHFKGDEQVFYSKKVTSEGQIIGAILAKNRHIAQKATNLVHVKYEPLEPIVINIDDAIKDNSFFHDYELEICHGSVDEILKKASHVIKGCCKTGNQKPCAFELQSCLVVPQDDDVMEIYSSTQSPAELARKAAELLGVYENKIKVHVSRLGGAFGGKEWKSIVIAQPAILAAKKFQRPIRCVLERSQDMLIGGGRIPTLFNYTVGFDEQGRILACKFNIYMNCGYSLEINHEVLRKNMNLIENAFSIPAIKVKGRLCKTNIPSNIAMRGCEGQFPSSIIAEEIAEYLKKDPAEIAEINLYKEGDTTFYGQKLENCTMKRCWDECLEKSKYWEKRKEHEKFNSENRYKKRGISIVPTKFGIGLANEVSPLSQAVTLVVVYIDGSLLLSQSGIEMGQGLHTRMLQIITRVLGIPAEKILIDRASTNMVPNYEQMVNSKGLEFYEQAVIDACEKIKKKILPYQKANPSGTWEEWVSKAYNDKVSLTATGFFKHVPEEWDPKNNTGNLFNYFVYGAACTEVEVDALTGDHQVLRTDIVMDVGESLNPAIDIGQIEGSFLQGYGLFILEKTQYSPQGKLLTKGPSTYKLPGIRDIPGQFNVSLLKRSSNPKAVYCSKAVGGSAVILGSSVYFAIKDALKAVRKANGASTAFYLECPATSEKIRLACEDPIVKMCPTDDGRHQSCTVTS